MLKFEPGKGLSIIVTKVDLDRVRGLSGQIDRDYYKVISTTPIHANPGPTSHDHSKVQHRPNRGLVKGKLKNSKAQKSNRNRNRIQKLSK